MPAKKTTTKRKSEPIVENVQDLKKVKGKSLSFQKVDVDEGVCVYR